MPEGLARKYSPQETQPAIFRHAQESEEAKVADTLRLQIDKELEAGALQEIGTQAQTMTDADLDGRIDELLFRATEEAKKLDRIMKKTADRQKQMGVIAAEVGAVDLPETTTREMGKFAALAAELKGKWEAIEQMKDVYLRERDLRDRPSQELLDKDAANEDELPPPLPKKQEVTAINLLGRKKGQVTPWTQKEKEDANKYKEEKKDQRIPQHDFLDLTGRSAESLKQDSPFATPEEKTKAEWQHQKDFFELREVGFGNQFRATMNEYRATQARIAELEALSKKGAQSREARDIIQLLSIEQQKANELKRQLDYLNDELDKIEQRKFPLHELKKINIEGEIPKNPEALLREISSTEHALSLEQDIYRQESARNNTEAADFAMSRMVSLENKKELLTARFDLVRAGIDPDRFSKHEQITLAALKKEFDHLVTLEERAREKLADAKEALSLVLSKPASIASRAEAEKIRKQIQMYERQIEVAQSSAAEEQIIQLDHQIKDIEGSVVAKSGLSYTPSREQLVKTVVGKGTSPDINIVDYLLKPADVQPTSEPVQKAPLPKPAVKRPSLFGKIAAGVASLIGAFGAGSDRTEKPVIPAVKEVEHERTARREYAQPERLSFEKKQEKVPVAPPDNLPISKARILPDHAVDSIVDRIHKDVRVGETTMSVPAAPVAEKKTPEVRIQKKNKKKTPAFVKRLVQQPKKNETAMRPEKISRETKKRLRLVEQAQKNIDRIGQEMAVLEEKIAQATGMTMDQISETYAADLDRIIALKGERDREEKKLARLTADEKKLQETLVQLDAEMNRLNMQEKGEPAPGIPVENASNGPARKKPGFEPLRDNAVIKDVLEKQERHDQLFSDWLEKRQAYEDAEKRKADPQEVAHLRAAADEAERAYHAHADIMKK